MRFADCDFIDKAETIFITGSTGIGKSYIASALGTAQQEICFETVS
jgi:DNA replication protein DnaC